MATAWARLKLGIRSAQVIACNDPPKSVAVRNQNRADRIVLHQLGRVTAAWVARGSARCFDAKTNTCPIDPVCGLKGALLATQKAAFRELDRFTLADFEPKAPGLLKLWKHKLDAG